MTNLDIPTEYMHPELMAIGDSMYNGVRSLTVSGKLNRFSPPAQVARALGLDGDDFTYPQMEAPIYLDMELFVREFPLLHRISAHLADYAEHWESWWDMYHDDAVPKENVPLLHDNLAIASMNISDLYAFNWLFARTGAQGLISARVRGIRDIAKVPGNIVANVMGLNALYTLNPRNKPEYRDAQPVDFVKARKPKRLLVNIGSNEGLFSTGFNGNPILTPVSVVNVVKKFENLALHLSELADDTEIVVNELVLPSQIPNLMPVPEKITYSGTPPGPSGYYEKYENRFGLEYGSMDGDEAGLSDNARGQDGFVQDMNAGMRDVMKKHLGNRVKIVPIAEVLKILNHKHRVGSGGSDVIKVYTNGPDYPKWISNNMVEGNANFQRGGICGLDGMHPSVVGYGRIAQEVLSVLGEDPSKIDLTQCFHDDTLLSNMPLGWTNLLFLWRDIRRGLFTAKSEEESNAELLMKTAATFAPDDQFIWD